MSIMFKSGMGFLALFGLGWWLLASSAFGGSVRPAGFVAGCAVAVGLMLTARRVLPASAGGPFPADRRRRFLRINVLQGCASSRSRRCSNILGCVYRRPC
ncbi:hypothetical protein [Streptomyces sp. NPDC057381]|uniref:hypothetical protein n=1 Tax=Streptomyces sp. NPDC057381 TaxID=3346111 RepID=UPI00362ECCF4